MYRSVQALPAIVQHPAATLKRGSLCVPERNILVTVPCTVSPGQGLLGRPSIEVNTQL